MGDSKSLLSFLPIRNEQNWIMGYCVVWGLQRGSPRVTDGWGNTLSVTRLEDAKSGDVISFLPLFSIHSLSGNLALETEKSWFLHVTHAHFFFFRCIQWSCRSCGWCCHIFSAITACSSKNCFTLSLMIISVMCKWREKMVENLVIWLCTLLTEKSKFA